MLKTYAWMKSKYDLSLNVVALFRASHRFSFFFFFRQQNCTENRRLRKKKEGLWSKVKREYFPLRNCGRVLKLTSKQYFRDIHTQIWYADLSLVVMHCFSFSVIAGVKISGFRRIEQDWSWLLWIGMGQQGLEWIGIDRIWLERIGKDKSGLRWVGIRWLGQLF